MTPEQALEKYIKGRKIRHSLVGHAAGIHFLNGFLAGQQSALEWIPVTPETMPEFNKRVFVFNGRSINSGYLDESGKFYDEVEEFFSPPITHWMPLPQPPVKQ